MLQSNVEIFLKERAPEDLDLVESVRNLLVNSGLLPEVMKNFDNSNYIRQASSLQPEAQRFLLNRFWNLQLLVVEQSTIEERFCLITTGEYTDWLRLFKDKILPCAIANRLPTSIESF
jgi:hypothetical protein